MIETWLAAGTLAVLAAAFLIVGARRSSSSAGTDQAGEFDARRHELRSEAQAQGLESNAISALEEELALDAIDSASDVETPDSPQKTADTSPTPPLLPLCAGTLAVAVVSLALYALWGEPYAATLADAKTMLESANRSDHASLAELEKALAARIERKPNDGDGWYFLGTVRMRLTDYGGATDAFTALRGLIGTNPQVDLALAQASYMSDGGAMSATTRTLVDQALASNPQQLDLQELLAADALHRRDYLAAARHLLRALGQPMPAPRRNVLQQTLGLARANLDPERPRIEATIHAGGLSAPWLMVFARPVGGTMPLAAVRLPAQATQTVVLDDAAGMGNSAPLSALADGTLVEVVARISRTGDATAADAEAVSSPIDPKQHPLVALTLAAPPNSSS